MTIDVPDGTVPNAVDDKLKDEAQRARELSGQGHLRRLWALTAQPPLQRTLGLWNAHDDEEIDTIVKSLPLYPWMTTTTTQLSLHPSDPAAQPN